MSLLKSTIWLVFAEIVFTLSGYIIATGLARFLGPAEYGRYTLVIGFTTMIIIFVGRGIPTAMAKRISEHSDDVGIVKGIVRTAALAQIVIITLLTALFYFSAPFIAHAFGDASLTPLFKLSALIVPAFALSSFHVLYFNGLKRFGAMTAMKLSRGLFRIAWIVGLGYYFHTTGALTGAIIAPLCVFGVALIIDVFFTKKIKPHTHSLQHYPLKKLLSYAGGFMLFLLFYEFFVRADVYLIKIILGNDSITGYYSAAMTIALIPYYLLFALTFMLFPTISNHVAHGGTAAARILIAAVLRFLTILLLPAGALIFLFSKPLVLLFFGGTFAASATLVPFMIGGTIFGTFFFVLAAVFNGANMTRIPATLTAFAIIFAITANFMYLPTYGPAATAIIFSFISCVIGVLSMFFAWKVFGAVAPIMTWLRVIAATLLIIIIAPFVSIAHPILFLFSGMVLLLLYIITLILLGELSRDDIKLLKRNK